MSVVAMAAVELAGRELSAQGERLVDRLRSMALTKLAAPYDPEPTRVVAAAAVAQRLADTAAGIESPQSPTWRDLLEVSSVAIGDLLAICLHDVIVALPDAPEVVAGRDGGSRLLDQALSELATECLELRRRL